MNINPLLTFVAELISPLIEHLIAILASFGYRFVFFLFLSPLLFVWPYFRGGLWRTIRPPLVKRLKCLSVYCKCSFSPFARSSYRPPL